MTEITDMNESSNSAPIKLSGDVDEDAILEAISRSKGKDWKPLSADNWEEEISQMPLFMDKLPTNHADNQALQAIQALAYDGTPEEIALNFKNHGNDCYRSKRKDQMMHAIQYYTKALEQRCADLVLNVSCLLNRAAAQLTLENNRSAALDSSRALKLLLSHQELSPNLLLKAFYRLIEALLRTDKLDLAEKKLSEAFSFFSHDDGLLELDTKLKEKKLKLTQEIEKKQIEKLQHERFATMLASLFRCRGVKFAGSISFNANLAYHMDLIVPTARSPESLFSLPDTMASLEIHISAEDGRHVTPRTLSWPLNDPESYVISFPVVLIYPQTGQYDVVEAWDERVRVIDMAQELFQSAAAWDSEEEYRPDTVSFYLPIFDDKVKWTRARLLGPLWECLRIAKMAPDGILRFWVLPDRSTKNSPGSNFSKRWLKE